MKHYFHLPRITRAERLKSRKVINTLFKRGHSFVEYPLRVVWQYNDAPSAPPIQCGVTVSPRKFPRAVHRNRLKRLMREAYRHHKEILISALEGKQNGVVMMLLYISSREPTYGEIEEKIIASLQRLKTEYDHPQQNS